MDNIFSTNLFRMDNFDSFSTVKLLKVKENEFCVKELGEFNPILEGLIIEKELADLINKVVPEQIEVFKKVNIYRKATNESWNNYYLVIAKNNLELEDFEFAEYDDLRFYSFMYSSIYISGDLKKLIESEYSQIKKIEFVKERPFLI